MLIFALLGPFSIVMGTLLNDVPPMVHLVLNGLASGTFVYIGAYEVVHEEFSEEEKTKGVSVSHRASRAIKFIAMTIGVLAISLIALIPHEHTD